MERAKQKPTERFDGYDFYMRGLASIFIAVHVDRLIPMRSNFLNKSD